jgi:putative hydrolase
MASMPFGFSPGDPSRGVPDDLAGKAPLFAELQKLLASSGPVNWELARQSAIAGVGAAQEPLRAGDADEARDALRLADLWLDPVTALPSGVRSTAAWTRVEWIEQTQPVWATLCDPVAERVAASMQGALPEEAAALAGPLGGVLATMGGLMFGAQIGSALASLAGEVVSTTEIGLPLGAPGLAALVPAGVRAFGEGLELPDAEVRLYLALREAAHHRLYAHVPWLRDHVVSAVHAYARGITVDGDAIGRAMTELDPTDPESLQRALGGGLFQPETTPEQQAALRRLETALAVVEGWVDTVVGDAAAPSLPSAPALAETLRRRRASGGPAEQTFTTLVGLELRPRRLREAAALWRRIGETRGVAERDAIWRTPDLMPGADDLDDPEAYLRGGADLPDDPSQAGDPPPA